MSFEKKITTRLYVSIGFCVFGLALIVAAIITSFENHFILTYGLTMLCIGIFRILQNRKIAKSEKSMRRQEISESDERSRMISERAKSWTFSFSIILAGLIVIVLSLLGYHDQALPFSWFVCLMVAIYWIFWLIARKRY